jgi:hypothetical protein
VLTPWQAGIDPAVLADLAGDADLAAFAAFEAFAAVGAFARPIRGRARLELS